MKLTGKHVVVTGASSGIGEAIAKELGRAGCKVTIVARRLELLDKLAAEIGNGCHAIAHDLSSPAKALDWIAAAEQANGPIEILINNAGMAHTGPSIEASPEFLEMLLNLNFVVPLKVTRHLLPQMVAANSGAIVNVASVAGLLPMPWQTYYSATKAGLGGFSEALRGELLRTGVQVLSVYPGPVKTPMAEGAYAAVGGRSGMAGAMPEGTTEELATKIRKAIENRKARIIYPSSYSPSRWFPSFGRWLVDRAAPGVIQKTLAAKSRNDDK